MRPAQAGKREMLGRDAEGEREKERRGRKREGVKG